MNLNQLAKEIAKEEGLKKQVSIAQIKEILRLVFEDYALEDIVEIWLKYNRG